MSSLLVRASLAIAGTILSLPLLAADAASEHLYGAPAQNAVASNSNAGSIGQVTIALGVVLVVVFVAAWLLRNVKKLNLAGGAQRLEVIAQVSLGAKERAVLVRVNNMQVLIGVAPGSVTALHTFAASDIVSDAVTSNEKPGVATAPSFKSLLKKSLGLP